MKLTNKVNNMLENSEKSLKDLIANSKSAIAMMKLQVNNKELSDKKRAEAKKSLAGWEKKLKEQQAKLKALK